MTRVIAKGTGGHDVDSPSSAALVAWGKVLSGALHEQRLPSGKRIPPEE